MTAAEAPAGAHTVRIAAECEGAGMVDLPGVAGFNNATVVVLG